MTRKAGGAKRRRGNVALGSFDWPIEKVGSRFFAVMRSRSTGLELTKVPRRRRRKGSGVASMSAGQLAHRLRGLLVAP